MAPTPGPGGTPQYVGPGTPYITPAMLVGASTGISWSTIPDRNASPAQQYAAQLSFCSRATGMVDAACNQPLRATIDTDEVVGPGSFNLQLRPNGSARVLLTRSPIVAVYGGQVSAAAAFPPSWSTIAATQFRVERPVFGVYGSTAPSGAGEGGQAVILAPGWVSWYGGRENSLLQVTYGNGWAHGSLAEDAEAGDTQIVIDDVTCWEGAAGTIYDAGGQEVVRVTAVTPDTVGALSGRGTLTLAAPLAYSHPAGMIVTAMPGNAILAATYFATSQALVRGTTATTVQTISGTGTGTAGSSSEDLVKAGLDLLVPFARVM